MIKTIEEILMLIMVTFIIVLPVNAQTSRQRITIVSDARVRSAPQLNAAEIDKLPLGTIVRELEQSATKTEIEHRNDYWYRVAFTDGKTGWIFGGLTAQFDKDRRSEIYLKITADGLKRAPIFHEQAELTDLLARVLPELKSGAARAQLEFSQLMALKRALATVPSGKQMPRHYQHRLKRVEDQIVYSELSEEWYVNAQLFWDLGERYRKLPVGDESAWQAVEDFFPMECEGSIICNLAVELNNTGRYLKLYPRGAHVDEALKGMLTIFADTYDLFNKAEDKSYCCGIETAADRAEVKMITNELRVIITATGGSKKRAVLKQLDELAELLTKD